MQDYPRLSSGTRLRKGVKGLTGRPPPAVKLSGLEILTRQRGRERGTYLSLVSRCADYLKPWPQECPHVWKHWNAIRRYEGDISTYRYLMVR